MVKDELRKLLNQPYKSDNWKKITEFVFPNVSYLQKPTDIPFISDKVESFRQIGTVKLADGKNLAMFEVHVAENVNLSSNRVELRKLVAPLIDQERNHGVLVIYEQGKEDYRFTFTAKSTEFDEDEGDFVNVETDAKRFTYILGKNESCKTAANRFWELSSNKDKATIKEVEQAFSVERLNKEFFDKYKAFYEDFVQHITGKRFEKEKGKWVEKTKGKAIAEHKTVFGSDDKMARNFVKLLLGRLVFIQFLQKKGWMGVSSTNKKWINGDKEFTLSFFNSCKKQDKFHSDYLYKLFYNAFNTPNRPNDIFELTGTRVPYLNGGLFENDQNQTELINFPSKYFEGLLEFFGQYNFTIDENDPLDHEVGIDPEMLGHIFENLLEDNKDKGAFYTPKPVVQYMCQESLIQYLQTYLKSKSKWPVDTKEGEELIQGLQNFVRRKAAGGIIDFDEDIARALKVVKICDPAIGSGAFPMGLLNEIFYCMQVLHDANPDTVEHVWKMKSWSPDIVKKNIIQHSIYGVDLEKGAVDIARLRFWLSLIVDEKEPYPLPNLDFKIMQGNSLLESYEGIDLSQIAGTKLQISQVGVDLFGNPLNAQASIFDTTLIDQSNISELIEEYFNVQKPEEKQSLKGQIDSIIHKHVDFNLAFVEKNIHKYIENIERDIQGNIPNKSDSNGIKGQKEQNTIKLKDELSKQKLKLKNLQVKRKELHDVQGKPERPYFLWHLFFKDVLDSGGFDIVIGNPPYVGEKGNKEKFQSIKDSRLGRFYQKKMDLFYYFFHLALDITHKDSIITYITTNYYVTATGALKLRQDIKNRSTVLELFNFNELKLFESALGQHNLISILKNGANELENSNNKLVSKKGDFNFRDLQMILNGNSSYFNSYLVLNKDLFDGPNCYIRLTGQNSLIGSDPIQGILTKVKHQGTPLINLCHVNQGMRTGADKVSPSHIQKYKLSTNKGTGIFILSKAEVESLNLNKKEMEKIKPFFKNSDIKKYFTNEQAKEFLIDVFYPFDKDISEAEYPNLLKHLKGFKEILSGRKENANGLDKAIAKGQYWFGAVRRKLDFESKKILCPQRSKENIFAMNDVSWYSSADVYYITPIKPTLNMEEVLGILNSNLMFIWLYHRGKRKGESLELYQVPLSEMPIKVSNSNVISDLVKQIVTKAKNNLDYSSQQEQLNIEVYKLYDIQYEEVKILDPDFKISEKLYNSPRNNMGK